MHTDIDIDETIKNLLASHRLNTNYVRRIDFFFSYKIYVPQNKLKGERGKKKKRNTKNFSKWVHFAVGLY